MASARRGEPISEANDWPWRETSRSRFENVQPKPAARRSSLQAASEQQRIESAGKVNSGIRGWEDAGSIGIG